jgi:hypothetical protein
LVKQALFIRRFVDDSPYELWFFEYYIPTQNHNERLFILKEKATGNEHYLYRTKQLWKILGTWPGSNKKDPRYKH